MNPFSFPWACNDNVSSPMLQEWLGKTVDREDLTRHDKWCCMMLPRLKLLREFLTDDGAIFVSIDDNEVHRLRCLMDEVFWEENLIGEIAWRNVTDNNPTLISAEHEYVVCYGSSAEFDQVFVIETKGLHLKHFSDTDYKRSVFGVCNERASRREWSEFAPTMNSSVMRFEVVDQEEWQKRLNQLLTG